MQGNIEVGDVTIALLVNIKVVIIIPIIIVYIARLGNITPTMQDLVVIIALQGNIKTRTRKRVASIAQRDNIKDLTDNQGAAIAQLGNIIHIMQGQVVIIALRDNIKDLTDRQVVVVAEQELTKIKTVKVHVNRVQVVNIKTRIHSQAANTAE
jgi:hypothetical protein